VADEVMTLMYDPQTSGGLLVAVDPAIATDAVARLTAAGVLAATVGRVAPASTRDIVIRS
jgi:selenide,water dikinase